MARDLRAINEALKTAPIATPNPYTVLAALTPDLKLFTCIDLANAFFCLPHHPSVRDVFLFTYQGQKMRYTRLPQGFDLSPGIFNKVLKQSLSHVMLPPDCLLFQYVDDLLIPASTAEICTEPSITVLQTF